MNATALQTPIELRSHAMSAAFSLSWESELARHTDVRVVPKYNSWRDLPPPGFERLLAEGGAGDQERRRYAIGELLADHDPKLVVAVSRDRFNRLGRRIPVEPHEGRFYPRGMIAGVNGIFSEEYQPMRLVEVAGERLAFDLNPPLAGRALELRVKIEEVWELSHEHGGTCNDCEQLLTAYGPGMQARYRGRPTRFPGGHALRREDEREDRLFYAEPRLVSHLDATAKGRLTQRMATLIPAGSRVLDLMSSRDSHLPEGLEATVTGLGLNATELERNPRLAERRVHDLNLHPHLPFADGAFDVATCHLSVEYLTAPEAVFAEVARVVRPGGRLVVSFSNRWFPPKVINLWPELHEFERVGLVLEYFHADGRYDDLESWSLRGLPRPLDDPHIRTTRDSDPLYVVSGRVR